MSSITRFVQAAAVATALALTGSPAAFAAQGPNDLSAFAGRWQMNAAKTHMGRAGPNGNNTRRSPTFTWQFTPEGKGLRMDVFNEYPQPAPTRTMSVIVDGKPHGCAAKNKGACLTSGGNAGEQTYAYQQMDGHMLTRLFFEKGKVVEYSSYAVSSDGKTLTIVSWSPETPEYQNVQVFDKQP